MACGHCWEPIFTWNGRYRCKWCGAVGYRNIVTEGARGHYSQITPYICKVKGCVEPATGHGKAGQYCRAHRT